MLMIGFYFYATVTRYRMEDFLTLLLVVPARGDKYERNKNTCKTSCQHNLFIEIWKEALLFSTRLKLVTIALAYSCALSLILTSLRQQRNTSSQDCYNGER
jgi:hypothetical protein